MPAERKKVIGGGVKTPHAVEAPFSLSFYETPDGFTACFLVPEHPEKEKDPEPVHIASVRSVMLKEVPGLFDDFKAMMVKVVRQAVIATTGRVPVGWEAVERPIGSDGSEKKP